MSKFCQNCGQATNDSDKFCHKCGTKLYDSQDVAVIQEQARTEVMQVRQKTPQNMAVQQHAVQFQPVYVQYVEEPYTPDQGWREMFFRWDNRLNRKRFFMRLMLLQSLMLLCSFLLLLVFPKDIAQFATMIVVLIWMVPMLMLGLRRCHDLGHSGWFLIKTIIPVLGMMWLIKYFLSNRDDDTPALSSTFFVVAIGLPFVSILVWIYLMCAEGMRGENEYGPDPLGQQAEMEPQKNKVLAILNQMEAPGEMKGVLGILAAMLLVTVIPGMVGSLFTDSKSAALPMKPEMQQVQQSQQTSQGSQSSKPVLTTDSNVPLSPEMPKAPSKPSIPEPVLPSVAQENYEKAKMEKSGLVEKGQTEKKEENQGANKAQKEAINTLQQFHGYITQHELRNAYNCMSNSMKKRVSYDGWAPGFKTTVSSEVLDVKVYSETKNKIVLTYYLKAVDNPGGTKNYTGTAVMVKGDSGWKVDETTNKLKK